MLYNVILADRRTVVVEIHGHFEKCTNVQIQRVLCGGWLDSEVM